jgi:tetratricopeptide (TPR) repeat protein
MQSVLHHKPVSTLERLHDKGEGSHVVQFCCRTMPHQHNGGVLRRDTDRQARQSQLQTALKTFKQALAKAEADNNYAAQVDILKRIGLIHCKMEEYAWGIKRLEQALRFAKALRNQVNIGVILNYLGAAYYQTGQDHKALRLYLQALAIFREVRDLPNVARIFNRLGQIYNSLGQSEQALPCCRQALKMFQDLDHSPDGESTALHSIGKAHLQLGASASSDRFF